MKSCFIIIFLLLTTLFGEAQNFVKTQETIAQVIEGKNTFHPTLIGFLEKKPVFIFYDNLLDSLQAKIKQFDERKKRFSDLGHSYIVSKTRSSAFNSFNSFFFYCNLYFESILDYGYGLLMLGFNGNRLSLDSIYNADKKLHSSFSSDGRYLLVNTLNTLSDYYNPQQDNRIMVYDLSEINQGKIKKEYVPCHLCSDSYLVNDTLFFTVARKDAYDGYSIKDIYKAPWGKLDKRVKIASNTELFGVTPDGKYLLGARFFDRQKSTVVIVDAEQRRYQMLLGRDYYNHKAFYSHYEKKFAFDFNGYLIYVDFPDKFPFDAQKWRNDEIPDWTEKAFWQQFEHEPLPEN